MAAQTSNGSPDGTYKEHEFTLDMAQRIKPMLERHGIDVVLTRDADTSVSLTQRAVVANNANVICLFPCTPTPPAQDGAMQAV